MFDWMVGIKGFLYVLALTSSVWISTISTMQDVSSEKQEEPFSIPSSAKIVKQCPSGKIVWTKSANAKNCTAFQPSHSNFTFVYHCLINEWANATVEVCARRVHVLFGKCAEYNFGAKRIQSSDRRLCNRTVPPCPNVYNSTDAFMYQSCYNFSTVGEPPELPTNASSEKNSSRTFSSPQHHTNANANMTIIIPIAVLVCLAVFVLSIVMVIYRYKSKNNTQQLDLPPDHDGETNAFISNQ